MVLVPEAPPDPKQESYPFTVMAGRGIRGWGEDSTLWWETEWTGARAQSRALTGPWTGRGWVSTEAPQGCVLGRCHQQGPEA